MRVRGPLLAAAVCLAALAGRALQNRGVVYDRFHLPAFDGHVYAAMAEEPRVFTVAPWGYRLLSPWLVHLSPWNAARGYGLLTPGAILAAGLLTFALARRLGSGDWMSVAAAAVLVASDPVARILRYVLLVEPLTLALEALFLWALAAGVAWPVLALVGALGTLSKEFFLLLLPAVFLARARDGVPRAAAETAGVVAPALALTLVLRRWWTPYLAADPGGLPDLAGRVSLWLGTEPRAALLLAATAGLAAFGAPRAGRVRWAFAYVAAVAWAAPFLNPSDFSVADLPRLHVYVLPPLLPLAVLALDRRRAEGPAPARATPPWLGLAAGAGTLVLLAAPFLLLDRYRRVDLRGDGDAARVLATCRGTLTTADRLAHGETVVLDALRADADDPGSPRLRFYLRGGWEAGDGAARAASARAELIVPARPPTTLEATLELASPAPGLRVALEGHPLPVAAAEDGLTVVLPAGLQVRGDNRLTLERDPAPGGLELRRLRLRPRP